MAKSITEGLDPLLDDVQGCLDKNISNEIVNVLDYDKNVKPQTIQKLLQICTQGAMDDPERAKHMLNIICVVLRKVAAGELGSEVDLLPSMLKILQMMKTSIYGLKSNEIKLMYFNVLVLYPDEVYLKLEEDHAVLEIFDLYLHDEVPIVLKSKAFGILLKYLKVLRPEKRLKFVEQGINIWFLKLVPSIMVFASMPDFEMEIPLATFEIIVDEFHCINYYDNPNFQCILQYFNQPQKYPTIMTNLLATGSNIWHRLWILFLKILKNHLTKSGVSGSPINSMLPVVETAFKMNVTNRCRAFQCWNALIDNFASETNEAHINKRIKLILIPLNSNNAKVEATVIAKLNTWWHLIFSYYSKLNNFPEIILIPFLQFCFGKPFESDKSTQIPGMLTDKSKELCVEALVNIFGHYDCDGCVSLPALKGKILNDRCFLVSSKNLMCSIITATKIVANCASKLRQSYNCAWKSFIKSICDITDDTLRTDIFNELLVMLEGLMQHIQDDTLADIVVNDMVLTLFKEDFRITQLLNNTDEPGMNNIIQKFMLMIRNPSFDSIYERIDMCNAVENLKVFTDFIVKHCCHISIIEGIINRLSKNYKSFVIWTAMTLSISEKKFVMNQEILCKILHWPLQYLKLLTNVEFCTSVWLTLFEFMHVRLGTSSITDEIFKILNDPKKVNDKICLFFLNVAIILLTQRFTVENGIEYEKEVSFIHDVLNKIHDLNHTHAVFSKLIDILLELLKKLLKYINLDIAKQVLNILKHVFSCLVSELKKSNEVDSLLLMKVEQMLKGVEDLLKLEAYESLKQIVLSELIQYAPYFGKQQLLKATVLAILQMFLNNLDHDNPFSNVVKTVMASLSEDSKSTVLDDKCKFNTPNSKKGKKKEPNIINTVVEDGEEFVVVKSNWKFNPKKLTEHQKEKLKRKRDIPALYQDLSQSQDEFKLSTWKTDSQDTTTTNSTSNELSTSEKVSSILKNMPNTDVVPKILKNILIEKTEKKNSNLESTNEVFNEIQTPINKKTKPRLSLKDRIFRNAKLLAEKSDAQNDDIHGEAVIDDIMPRLQTPTGMRIKISDSCSAPSESNTDRPSRVKRKPKKFEEMQIFDIKKRRHSLCNNESHNKDLLGDLNHSQVNTENSEVEETKQNQADNVSENQGNYNILAPNLNEDLKHCDEQSVFSGEEEMPQNDITECQQQNNKSKGIVATSLNDVENDVDISVNDISVVAMADKNQTINDKLSTKEDSSIENLFNKKTGKKKSRIEKELAIDMVEGHPFLKAPLEKRITRKKTLESPVISRRKSSTQKLNKSKVDQKNTPIADRNMKETDKLLDKSMELDTFSDSQEYPLQDENGSQDVIESSQDSTMSVMSAKSSKTVKRIPIVTLEHIEYKELPKINPSDMKVSTDVKIGTLNFDTESIANNFNEVIVINDEENPPIANKSDSTYNDIDTQDIADADTQPIDLNIVNTVELENNAPADECKCLDANKFQEDVMDSDIDIKTMQTQEETTKSLSGSLLCEKETKQDDASSKLSSKDEEQRKQDFLNNTLEISPIKTLSPVREYKSPSPETSSDYVVIKLSSPVQTNGEPFEKCDSPEIFTEDKVSPDKRDQSPPRPETRVITTSPRSLSLKKAKPQVRSGGRAAQMLGLCIPGSDRLQAILNCEKSLEPEEPKKSSPLNSSARRNLRILYNSTNETEFTEETEESTNFLKMKRSLPAADSSPTVPILKRKLADIVDDTTVSSASKRKRVSFHDPPVSTTVCVKKYIDSGSVRSPQNSATKRQERQSRSLDSGNLKSQKRLDSVFKLDTALIKAVESFSEGDVTPGEETEISSLEPTPLVEVVRNSELNDIDPICLDLINCKHPIDNIAADLSSSAMRPLLVKEFAGKIETVGDLAKLTELEVNRLCIKAPKVQVAKKVLTEYAKKINSIAAEMTPMTEAAFSESSEFESKTVDVEMQTVCVATGSVEVQTEILATSSNSTQTDIVSTVDCEVQTDETNKPTSDIVKSLLLKSDFCDHLKKLLDTPSKLSIATSLPVNVLTDTVVEEMNCTYEVIDSLLEKHVSDSINGPNDNPRLLFMRNYLSEYFNPKDLILLCSDLLKKIHDDNN